ncbi:MAG: phenylalanine--tRNA ligase subunit beta, partial [Deltaproteobacteria bacterium]|nr:phenylalanine--tRNA ligase subunit beta [Deltaproteobacteria bacterium]
ESNSYLGISMTRSTAIKYLRSLEMEIQHMDGDLIRVVPPSFRVDITRAVDLMEELARLEGYDRIPVTSPAIRPSEDADLPQLKLQERMSEVMAGLGFSEIITYSFISPDSADLLGAEEGSPLRAFVELQNPLTVDQSVMRTSLLPGLLATMNTNITHEEADLKLFEYGKVFFKNDSRKLPDEKHFLAGIMTGMYLERDWHEEDRQVDFYDIKGSVEVLMNSLGLHNPQYKRCDLSAVYHPQISCGVFASDRLVGSLGRISSKVMESYDIRAEEVYLFELDTEAILELLKRKSQSFKPFTKYPAVFRDLSLVMDRRTESAVILDIIKREGADLVESVKIFDLYEGEKMGPSEKAISFSICYRSKDGTLDGKEVNRLHEAIIQRLGKETGGRLREG